MRGLSASSPMWHALHPGGCSAIPTRPDVFLLGDTLRVGGTEGQFAEIASRLSRSRWTVDVSCLRAEGPLRAKLEARGVEVWSCGPGSFKSPRFATAVWRLSRHLRSRRVSLFHSFDFYSNILGVPAARLAGVPAIIASQRELSDLRTPRERRIQHCILRMAHRVAVNSAAVAEQLKHDGAAMSGRVVLISNGVDVERFSPSARTAWRAEQPLRIGTLANLRPEKGLEDLVEAAALVLRARPDVRFVLWGEGPIRVRLEQLIARLELAGSVELPGPTSRPEEALRDLDIFVLPSRSEATSNAILEAMATGLPIVATRVGGPPGLVEHERTGLLVPPRDPAALGQAIGRLLDDPALSGRLGVEARAVVCSRFAPERMLARLESLYEELLGIGPRLAATAGDLHAYRNIQPGG